MKQHKLLLLVVIFVLLFGTTTNQKVAHAQTPVVCAVLFYSPSCGQCHKVIEEALQPLKEKYKDQLDIVGIDVSVELGQALYQAALAQFRIPDERIGVPTIIVGETVLVGPEEIPTLLPGIIDQGLAAGGIDWPDIIGLKEVLAAQPIGDQPQSQPAQKAVPGWVTKFFKDPIANSIAVILLLAMIHSVIGVAYTFIRGKESRYLKWPRWVLPFLALVGLFIAIYLTYIEISQANAICGPVGDCNSVQQSPYATLFGLVPIGVLGTAGYVAILIAWLVGHYGPSSLKKLGILAIWGMAWFGILFSIYLTFLEPFVIGATCAWCISSAIVMTLILWASTEPVKEALRVDDEDLLEDNLEDLSGE